MLSRLPSGPSLELRKMLLPPSCAMPASKLTRVRSDCFSNNRPRTRPAVHGQFQADHDALDPHLLHQRAAPLQRFQALTEFIAQLRGAFEQAVLVDGLDSGQRGGTGQRVAPEGGRVSAGPQLLGELR